VKNVLPACLLMLALFSGHAAMAGQNPEGAPRKLPEGHPAAVAPTVERRPVPGNSVWTLERLVNEAVTLNPETLSKRASLEAAEATADAALQKFFPTPYAQLQQVGSNGSGSYADRRVGVLGISQPIWTGGKLTAELNTARSSASSAGYSVTETQLSLANRVVNAYQGLAQYQGRIRAQEESILLLEKYAATIERRVTSGVSAPSDQEQLNSRLSLARSELTTYSADQRAILAQMSQLVGRPLAAGDIAYDHPAWPAELPDPDALIEQALRVNPTLHRLQADLKTVEHQEEQQRAALMPTLGVKAEHRDDAFLQSGKDEYGAQNLVYLSLDFSPGAGLSSLANIEAAKAKTRGAQQAGEAYRRELAARIQGDYTDYQSSSTRRRLLEQNVRTSKAVLESYNRLFAVGKRSWLDVLNAARELTQGELAVADTLALSQASAYRLRLHAGDTEWLRQRQGSDSAPEDGLAPERESAPAQGEQHGE